jgi:glycosyltransferase involved in cell wall biosynthesis
MQETSLIEDSPTTEPLVSIVVLTYNSEATVIETLDSLLKQEYGALELIVTDDGSKDGTVSLVKEWMATHANAFRRAQLVADTPNQGVCGNVAKGYAAALGTWIKPIAGDDMLLPGAIPRYVAKALEGDYAVVFSQMATFTSSPGREHVFGRIIPTAATAAPITESSRNLREIMRVRNILPAPAVLLRRADFESVGGIDRRFCHLDDWPLWNNLLMAGARFAWLPEPLVAYRVSETTLSASKNSTQANPQFLQDHIAFYKHYQIGQIPLWRRWDRMLEIFRFKLAKNALRGYPRIYTATGVLRLLSPIYLLERLRR